MGNTVFATDQSGNIAGDERYYAYGRGRYGSITLTDHRFTGQKLDVTGLYYYGSRYYDPELGQFISPDTLVPDPVEFIRL